MTRRWYVTVNVQFALDAPDDMHHDEMEQALEDPNITTINVDVAGCDTYNPDAIEVPYLEPRDV